MALTQIFLSALFLLFPFGQLLRINIANTSILAFDVFLIIFTLLNIKKTTINKAWLIFILLNLTSFLFATFTRQTNSLLPLMYQVRLMLLILFFNQELPKINPKIFIISMFSTLAFGFIQFFTFPDNTIMAANGWDPHLNRMIGSFLDPTFTALIFLFILIFLYFTKPKSYLLLIATYLGIALTYSRSTMLALAITSTFYGLKTKNYQLILTVLLLIFSTIFLLPNTQGEGTNLKRTSTIQAKIENYKEGFSAFMQKPIFGHGYNYLSQIRLNQGHATFGFDNSLLTLATTNGILGLLALLFALKQKKRSQLETYLTLAFFVHSCFANSLLYTFCLFLYKYFSSQKS